MSLCVATKVVLLPLFHRIILIERVTTLTLSRHATVTSHTVTALSCHRRALVDHRRLTRYVDGTVTSVTVGGQFVVAAVVATVASTQAQCCHQAATRPRAALYRQRARLWERRDVLLMLSVWNNGSVLSCVIEKNLYKLVYVKQIYRKLNVIFTQIWLKKS